MAYAAYILKSLSYGNYYYGSSENPNARLKSHNAGKVRYTKGRRPWVMHYMEEVDTRSEAFRRKMFFKSVSPIYKQKKRIIS
nr:GIY-YIG nuclease family protein [Bacteroidota bacterium]